MFGIGAPEMALIVILGLIFIGPAKLPEVARTVGRTYREFQKALDGLKDEIAAPMQEAKLHLEKSTEEDEIRKIKSEIMETKKAVEAVSRKPLDIVADRETKTAPVRPEQIN